MFRPTIALAAAVLALVIIAGGCGGGYGSDDSPAAAPPAAKPAAGEPAVVAAPGRQLAAAKTIKVDVDDNLFGPATVRAKVGQKITWTLNGQIAHTVSATAGAKFESGPLSPGQSFSYVTKKAGTISYLCRFHQGMEGTIVVS